MKRRVHFIESYRESRQLKRDADEEVEDGLGAAHRPASGKRSKMHQNQKRQAATGTPVIALQYKEVSPVFGWWKAGSELVAAFRTE